MQHPIYCSKFWKKKKSIWSEHKWQTNKMPFFNEMFPQIMHSCPRCLECTFSFLAFLICYKSFKHFRMKVVYNCYDKLLYIIFLISSAHICFFYFHVLSRFKRLITKFHNDYHLKGCVIMVIVSYNLYIVISNLVWAK